MAELNELGRPVFVIVNVDIRTSTALTAAIEKHYRADFDVESSSWQQGAALLPCLHQQGRAVAPMAGIKKRVYPHLVRHSFATDYLRRGGAPILLQQILGRTSLAMITQTYQHLAVTDAHEELMRVLTADPR